MNSILFDVTVVICLSAFFGIICRLLKQPLILAYILTGVIIGPIGVANLHNQQLLEGMGELGITLLLFILGLELKFNDLKSIGKTVIIASIFQIIITFIIGFLFSLFFNFSLIASIYIGLALTFSSTIMVVKLLGDKRDISSLYGKISVGILLAQDLLAIFTLIILSGFKMEANTVFSVYPFIFVIFKGIILFALVYFLSIKVLPRIVDLVAKSHEALFLFSLAVAFGVAAFVSLPFIGFSIEIGGLLAGLALANSNEKFQIAARIRALRDFFITIFFVFLGTQIILNTNIDYAVILVFLIFIFAYKPIIVMTILGLLGYKKRTSFLTAINLAQVSEFSLIIVFLGNKLHHISSDIVTFVTALAAISFVGSNYLILGNGKLYTYFEHMLGIFEKKARNSEKDIQSEEYEDHVILIGAHRMGECILEALEALEEKEGKKLVVIDFDPDIIHNLERKKVKCLFGDITDLYIQEKVRLDKARLVVSTIPDLDNNLTIIKEINRINKKAKIIVMAQDNYDAKILYKKGADYVILPHLAGGLHVARMLKENNLEHIEYFRRKDKDS